MSETAATRSTGRHPRRRLTVQNVASGAVGFRERRWVRLTHRLTRVRPTPAGAALNGQPEEDEEARARGRGACRRLMGRGSSDQNDTLEPVRRSATLPAAPSDLTPWLLGQGVSQSMQVLVLVLRKLQASSHRAVPVGTLKSALLGIDWVALGREQELVPSVVIGNARKPSYRLVEFNGRGAVKLTPAGRDYARSSLRNGDLDGSEKGSSSTCGRPRRGN